MQVNIDIEEPTKDQIVVSKTDLWNVDYTLARIIHPVLCAYQKEIKGAPSVDDEDVPEHIRSSSAKPKENSWDLDEFFFQRWEFVVSEMIWGMAQVSHFESEEQFYSENKDTECQGNLASMMKIDYEGLEKHNERIENSLRLFGKYFRCLWT
jgi:hypothetical protein